MADIPDARTAHLPMRRLVDVVVITRDRRELLRRSLRHTVGDPAVGRVLVVDNGSSDGTLAMLRSQFPAVEVVEAGRNLGAAGRTLGVASATAPYVAFVDDDSWWARGALAEAAAVLGAHPRLGLLAGRVLIEPDLRVDPVSGLMAASPLGQVPAVGPRVLGFLACAAVVRRDAYLEVGGFHHRYGVGGEEALLATDLLRHGWECAYRDELTVHHAPEAAGRTPTARRRRQLRNDVWTRALRRPVGTAARAAWQATVAERSPQVLAEVVRSLPWLVRERRVDDPWVEHLWRVLEREPAPRPS